MNGIIKSSPNFQLDFGQVIVPRKRKDVNMLRILMLVGGLVFVVIWFAVMHNFAKNMGVHNAGFIGLLISGWVTLLAVGLIYYKESSGWLILLVVSGSCFIGFVWYYRDKIRFDGIM